MSKGLTRAASLLLGGLLCCAAGCGTDVQDTIISRMLNAIDQVNTNLSQVKKDVNEALAANAKKKQQDPNANPKLTETDPNLLRAYTAAQDLRKLGEGVQRLKADADRYKDKTSADLRKDLDKRYSKQLQDKVLNLEKEYNDVNMVLADAEASADDNGKKEVGKIREEIKKGVEAFQVLTKQR
jgi:hypothetical protein